MHPEFEACKPRHAGGFYGQSVTAQGLKPPVVLLPSQGVPAACFHGHHDRCGRPIRVASPVGHDGRVLRAVQVLHGVCATGQAAGSCVEVRLKGQVISLMLKQIS